MLAQIRDRFRGQSSAIAILILLGGSLASCATKPQPQIFSDANKKGDSSLPWNEQQKWEAQGQFGPMAERQGGGDNGRNH